MEEDSWLTASEESRSGIEGMTEEKETGTKVLSSRARATSLDRIVTCHHQVRSAFDCIVVKDWPNLTYLKLYLLSKKSDILAFISRITYFVCDSYSCGGGEPVELVVGHKNKSGPREPHIPLLLPPPPWNGGMMHFLHLKKKYPQLTVTERKSSLGFLEKNLR